MSARTPKAPFMLCRVILSTSLSACAGSTSPAVRQEYVSKFQTQPSCRVALLSLTAASTGLTLTKAHHVVSADDTINIMLNHKSHLSFFSFCLLRLLLFARLWLSCTGRQRYSCKLKIGCTESDRSFLFTSHRLKSHLQPDCCIGHVGRRTKSRSNIWSLITPWTMCCGHWFSKSYRSHVCMLLAL
jgi:hypothetical protein